MQFPSRVRFSASILATMMLASVTFSAAARAQEHRITLSRKGPHESIWIGNVELLRYNRGTVPAPVGIDPEYARSGYIHPVRTPAGVVVTGDFPPDHAHQHAIFSAWTNTSYDGKRVDFWNQQKATGSVSFLKSARHREGIEHAEFTVVQKHEALNIADSPQVILEESWNISATLAANLLDQSYFVFNIELAQRNVTDKPLKINKYHYGGMALRGNNLWFSQESAETLQKVTSPDNYPPLAVTRHRFLTSDGKRRLAGNASRPDWVDLSGLVDGKLVGITVMSHPSNFRHPQPVRLHPTKPYLCFSPCAIGEFEIKPNETYRARYRYVVHDGGPNVEQLDRLWKQYAE